MPQYLCRGRLELMGVVFTIEAANEQEAKEKARRSEYVEYDISGAATMDCFLRVSSVKIDE